MTIPDISCRGEAPRAAVVATERADLVVRIRYEGLAYEVFAIWTTNESKNSKPTSLMYIDVTICQDHTIQKTQG